MSNKMFPELRRKLTIQYSLVSGLLIFVIVFATYALNWWSILAIEKKELHEKAIHEGEEWINSQEMPVNDKELLSEEMLAYFVKPDGKTVIIDQMGSGAAGKAMLSKRGSWPDPKRNTRMIRAHDEREERHFHYLATLCPVRDKGETVGFLYMFKNMDTYYDAGWRTLNTLGLLFVILMLLAGLGSFRLAGNMIRPIGEAYEKQKQFTADASHEMRTPIAVMKLAVQGIKTDEDSRLSSFSVKTAAMLEQEIDRLGHLTETLMTMARGDSEALEQSFDRVAFSELCQEVVEQFQLIARRKNIGIVSSIAPGIVMEGDRYSLHRLVVIILDNAVKYSPAGTEIRVTLTADKNLINLQIADQGIGISSEEKKKIFERFYRVDKTRSRSMGGLGLGLSLAKSIVDHHQGKILVENNSPQGSLFTVRLPKSPAE